MIIKFKVPKSALFVPQKFTALMAKTTNVAVNDMTEVLKFNIRKEAPVGATTQLKNTVQSTVNKNVGRVFTGVDYAVVIEKGRRAAPVARGANLKIWIRRSKKGQAYFAALKSKYKNITLAGADFLLRRSLKNKKRNPDPFFERGINDSKSTLRKIQSDTLKKMAIGLTK